MAKPTAINDQATDALSQTNVTAIASAPAVATASLYQVLSSSLSLAIQNCVTNQQQLNSILLASTTSCVSHLLDTKVKSVKIQPKNNK